MSPQSGADFLKRAKRVKRRERIQVCVRPDLVERHQEMSERLSGLQVVSGERLASAHTQESRELAQAILDLEDDIEANYSAWFTFEQLDRPAWQAILDNNPPRPDHHLDLFVGYNRDAVLDDAIHDCLIDPVFDDCDGTIVDPDTSQKAACPHDDCGTYQQWEKETPPSQWAMLRDIVNLVNAGVVENPKSPLASRILGTPGDASERPAATG